MIEIIATAAISGTVGFLACAALTVGRVVDAADWEAAAIDQSDRAWEAEKAHARCADALTTLQGKRDEILSIIDGNKTVRTSRIRGVIE